MFANAKYVCIYHSFCRVGSEVNTHEFMLFYASFHFQTTAGLAQSVERLTIGRSRVRFQGVDQYSGLSKHIHWHSNKFFFLSNQPYSASVCIWIKVFFFSFRSPLRLLVHVTDVVWLGHHSSHVSLLLRFPHRLHCLRGSNNVQRYYWPGLSTDCI